MSYSGSDVTKPNWAWRDSLEVGLYTLLLNAVLSFLLVMILQGISNSFNEQILGSPTGTAILGASEALLGIPLFLYSRKFRIDRFQLGMRVENSYQVSGDVLFGAIVGLAMVPISVATSALNEIVFGPQPNAEYISSAFTVTSPLELVLLLSAIVFVVTPFEEVIARGFIQSGFERDFGKLRGLILASLFFSLMHLSLWSIFPLLVLGIMLGLVFQLRHGRILAPITSHAIYMICLVIIASY